MKKVIINADDFGISEGVNRGIIECHVTGVVTSTSVMVKRRYATFSKDLLHLSNLSVGLHFEIVDKTLEKHIKHRGKLDNYLIRRIKRELDDQYQLFLDITGTKPSHINTHHGIHFHPQLFGDFKLYSDRVCTHLRGCCSPSTAAFNTSDGANNFSEKMIINKVDKVDSGVHEIYCHPGYNDIYLQNTSSYSNQREQEKDILVSADLRNMLVDYDVQLVSWDQALPNHCSEKA